MQKIDLGTLYKSQISLTEWFENLKHNKTTELRLEDNDKRERLKVLNELISLPYDRPTQFPATDLLTNTPDFQDFFKKHKKELCALRLIPHKTDLPKLRLRGITIEKALSWFKEQHINHQDYKADFVPHGDNQKWSTIFIVNRNGIFGEVIKGGHYQLTQGFYDLGEPITFAYNFRTLKVSKKSKQLEAYLKKIFSLLKVKNIKLQKQVKEHFGAKFYNNYLAGYFETVDTVEFGLWFIDYNRVLGDLYSKFVSTFPKLKKAKKMTMGYVASHGKAVGKVRIVTSTDIKNISLERGEILVCQMTTPNFVPLMKKAAAIITDFGGILSHAAIISRELGIPCLVGTQCATQVLKSGDIVEVDTKKASVTKVHAAPFK